MQLKNNLQSFFSSASHTTATNIGPRVATCSLRDLVLGWTTQHSFGRGISKVVYIEYHKFFPSFTNSALFLRPLCFQLNNCIFNRTSCSPPKWEEFLFFACRLWWRTGEGLEQIVARMLIICAHRSILPGATWQLILCSFEVLYFCGFDSIKSPAHVVINTSCLNVSRSLQAFVASRYNFERLSIRGRPKPKHVHVTTEVSDRCITSCDTEQGNTFTSPWPLTWVWVRLRRIVW